MGESKIVDGGARSTSRGARSIIATADPDRAAVSVGVVAGDRWAAAWATSLQRPSAGFDPNWSEEGFTDQTLRQVLRLSVGGDRLRVRLSNAFGGTPLVVTAATVAVSRGGGAVEPGTVRHLSVDGAPRFAIPVGTEVASDPVAFRSAPLDSIAVTMYLAAPTGRATFTLRPWLPVIALRAATAPTAMAECSPRPRSPGIT